MAMQALPAHAEWPAYEPKSNEFKLKALSEDCLPHKVMKFVDWEKNLRLQLDACDLVHHLDTKDESGDAIPDGGGDDADKKVTLLRLRKTNRKKVFLYLHQHCTKGMEAGNAAADVTHLNRPRTLLHALCCFYSVQSSARLGDLKEKFRAFEQKPGESIDGIYKRLTSMIKELEDQGYSPKDEKRRTRLLKALKNAEWDLLKDKEDDLYVKAVIEAKPQTFLMTYQWLKEQEIKIKLRDQGCVALSSMGASVKEEKAHLQKLQQKYPGVTQANMTQLQQGGPPPNQPQCGGG
jgi:hypothetical protein